MDRVLIKKKEIYLVSLGCPRNLVDTEVMLGILMKANYSVTQEIEKADVIVINTCGFLQAARLEALETIQDCLNKRKKNSKLIVTGCMVQNHSEEILRRFPQVDYLLGSGDIGNILAATESKEKGAHITTACSFLENGDIPRELSTPPHYAYLKVAEGCRKRCSYCIIPSIKGSLKSKPLEQVIREWRALRGRGAQEIILIAQDLGDWGKDFTKDDGCHLPLLLNEILKEKGDFWLRVMYLYPDEITDELISIMKSDSRICPYLDMPIQHVNDNILRLMKRKTSKKEIKEIISKLRRELPSITIRTSLIVGFPGETEKDFLELVDFIEEVKLDNVGVFIFSPEEGSRAALLPDPVSEEVKQDRYCRLMEAQSLVVAKKAASLVGKTLVAVVEGYHPDSKLLMVARHPGQAPDIDGCIIVNDTQKVSAFGKRYKIKITGVAGYDLVGSAISECQL